MLGIYVIQVDSSYREGDFIQSIFYIFKDAVKSVLRIGSAHNKGGPADINIAQISHLSNFSAIKLWFIFIYEHSKPEKIDIQL